jgi:alpha-beta hydrolase superfamily lysophospholipase
MCFYCKAGGAGRPLPGSRACSAATVNPSGRSPVAHHETLSGRPIYFGPAERPLFAWLHEPPDRVASLTALLCPSLGLEVHSCHQTCRRLADRLAGSGVAALRLDYDGTGDSAGSASEPDRVAAWTASVSDAVDALREAGAGRVVLIGIRAGALIAAAVAGETPPDALVLWDPPASGASFLEELRARRPGAARQPSAGISEAPGLVLPEKGAADLARLGVDPPALARVPRILLLLREEMVSAPFVGDLAGRPGVSAAIAAGQRELLEVAADAAEVPAESLERIARWCANLSLEEPARTPLHIAERSGIPLAAGAAEHTLRLGEHGLFGIVSEPSTDPSATVLLLNAGAICHTGPARAWVDLARELAGAGVRVARVDQSGLGDSPPRAGSPENVVYSSDAVADVREAAEALSPSAPSHVALVGLSAGGYHAIQAGQALGSRLVCAVNPALSPTPPGSGAAATAGPPAGWWLLDRFGLRSAPGRGLARLVEGGTELLLVCGEEDARPFRARSGSTLRRLERSGRVHFEVVGGLDHLMLEREARESALRLLVERLSRPAG